MRIRTIKPEFWPHPIMARQPDEVRLCAIALLNVADDEGYFLASPALVRSEVWPFDEDSSRARRGLDTLASIGWVEIRNHPTHGPIGKVVNFSKHQRIDRPSASKIASYFLDERSTNDRRALDERSLLDQGSGIRDQGAREQGSGTNSDGAASPPAAVVPRERNPIFDALAEMEGGAENLTKPTLRKVGVALSHIKKASPEVTPDEIRTRARNLNLHMPHATATATSLASHWARCATPPVNGGGNHGTPPPNPRNEWIGTPESRADWERESAARRDAAEKRILAGEIPFA